MTLMACTSCARLVRASDTACPFCSAAIVGAPEGSSIPRHLSRAAMLLGAAALGAACSAQPVYGAPVYGGPPTDSGVDDAKSDGPTVDAALDSAFDGPIAAYGGPPFDAGKQD